MIGTNDLFNFLISMLIHDLESLKFLCLMMKLPRLWPDHSKLDQDYSKLDEDHSRRDEDQFKLGKFNFILEFSS